MRMLHIRNMHKLHRRRSAHCNKDIPARPRLPTSQEAGSLAPITVSSTTRYLPYLH
jgi:hypothetical protein